MPQLGETVTEGTVGRWLKKKGEAIAKYEPLLEVETDKVASEIPSPFGGTVGEILVQEGDTVPVGAVVCEIIEAGVASSAGAAEVQAAAPSSHSNSGKASAASAAPGANSSPLPAQANGVRYSPAVRKLAREHQVDLTGLAGTGRAGRVTARDVVTAVQSGVAPKYSPSAQVAQAAIAATAVRTPAHGAPSAGVVAHAGEDDTIIRLSPMRKTIAERMVQAATTIPHAWCMMEADVTELSRWRDREKAAFKAREGVNLTYLPIVVQAVCRALKENPLVNSAWGGDHVIQRKHINVGIAIDVEEGLVVPVVRDADRLSLAGLAQSISELVDKARRRRLTMPDLTDGTITVDNTGALGNVASVPIINPPQAAIITMEAVVKRPWVVNDAIAIRSIMNLCLCLDHRVLDGAVASRFLGSVKKTLENYP
jgi:2-oxoisovalerate dehydrogenase E2 component (dihydrolipoyl transacylase)